jgi:C4-dicarboxylate-specific signal transduction histidine kinase
LEALKELIRNAVEAPRDGRQATVHIDHREINGDYIIDIRDNGTGISGATSDFDLSAIQSTKGRPGEGLSTVTTILLASRGRIRIAATSDDGTHIELYLPTRVGGLKSR